MRILKPTLWIFLALLVLGIPATSQAQVAVGISVHVGPPVLPIYEQPVIPAPGYIWTPGFWAYGPGGYYWVPGTWVEPPGVGLLWTPGYWGWGGGVYVWHGGYWGPHVGFYGGINYGFGYTGVGFAGGYWRGGAFYYNRAVANVGAGTTIVHNTYNTTVINNNTTINRTAYNGGPGGVSAKPTTAELAAGRESHVQPTAMQSQHQQAASTNRAMLASANHGQPAIAATAKPGVFKGQGVVPARSATGGQAAANAATNRNAAAGNSQANAHTAAQTRASPNTARATQPTYGGHPQQQPTYGAQAQKPGSGAQPSTASSQKAGGQRQVQPGPQPQRERVEPQHQGQPHAAEAEHEGKPHKP